MQQTSAACPPAYKVRGVWSAARRAAPAQIARPREARHVYASASSSNVGTSTAATAVACASSGIPYNKAAASITAHTASSADSAVVVLSTWRWRGHQIAFETAGPSHGKPILLVHGFGASGRHWRRTIPALAAAGHQVFTIDLLGQGRWALRFASSHPRMLHLIAAFFCGRSDKAAVDYSIELWAAQLRDFLAEVVAQPAVLIGNSVGSLASLTAAAEDTAGAVRGLVLLNCAGGMNNKAISGEASCACACRKYKCSIGCWVGLGSASVPPPPRPPCVTDDWRIKLAMPLFLLIDWILLQPKLACLLFEKIRQPDNLKNVLTSVYVNKASFFCLLCLLQTRACWWAVMAAGCSSVGKASTSKQRQIARHADCPHAPFPKGVGG